MEDTAIVGRPAPVVVLATTDEEEATALELEVNEDLKDVGEDGAGGGRCSLVDVAGRGKSLALDELDISRKTVLSAELGRNVRWRKSPATDS